MMDSVRINGSMKDARDNIGRVVQPQDPHLRGGGGENRTHFN